MPAAGSYNSALARGALAPVGVPPTINTLPFASITALCLWRALFIEPVAVQLVPVATAVLICARLKIIATIKATGVTRSPFPIDNMACILLLNIGLEV